MKKIYTSKRYSIRNNHNTIQVFDIFEVNISKKFFNKIRKHKNIFVTKNEKELLNLENVADNCKYIFENVHEEGKIKNEENRIRFSISYLVRLKYDDNYIFLVEDNIIKPFGGAYVHNQKLPFNNVILENPESYDLRFFIDSKDKDVVLSWWNTLDKKESNPLRELKEEMCLENEIVSLEEFNLEFS